MRAENHGPTTALYGPEANTTNNRMELMAVIRSLQFLPRGSAVMIHTDSSYVKNGVTGWLRDWKANNWRTSSNKPVKNEDLWRELDEELRNHSVDIHWVKGHANNAWNNVADMLANRGVTYAK